MEQQVVIEKTAQTPKAKKLAKKIVKQEGVVKIIPLGGLEEVGRNLTILEWVPKNGKGQIIVIDLGLGYPETENML
jgi:ribonuclease J